MALVTLNERKNDYNANYFINELFEASKLLGVLEAKISSYQFDRILIPMFRNKEAISSMLIEGSETTITDVLEDNIRITKSTKESLNTVTIPMQFFTERTTCVRVDLPTN